MKNVRFVKVILRAKFSDLRPLKTISGSFIPETISRLILDRLKKSVHKKARLRGVYESVW